jgi:ubiquinone/menaquinone biosynthesis C-methylase UbiE
MKTRVLAAAVSLTGSVAVLAQHGAGQGGHGQNQPAHMEHRFEDAEKYAKSFDDPARDAWQMPARVIEALALKTGAVIADVGAGTGYFTVRLAKAPAVSKVYAVDIESSMVEYVRQRSVKEGLKNVVAVHGASERTNLPEPVDLVLVVDTYHHIPSRTSYFWELRKSMKPGAKVAIIDFRKDSPTGPPVEFRFTADQITAELSKAGFRLETSHDFLPRQLFLVYSISPS